MIWAHRHSKIRYWFPMQPPVFPHSNKHLHCRGGELGAIWVLSHSHNSKWRKRHNTETCTFSLQKMHFLLLKAIYDRSAQAWSRSITSQNASPHSVLPTTRFPPNNIAMLAKDVRDRKCMLQTADRSDCYQPPSKQVRDLSLLEPHVVSVAWELTRS